MPARVGSESGSGRFGAYVGLLCDNYHMSDPSDPFAAANPIPNSFLLSSTENELSQEGNFEQLELSPNKRYALWRKGAVEYWNSW